MDKLREAVEALCTEWESPDQMPDAPADSVHGIGRILRKKHSEQLRALLYYHPPDDAGEKVGIKWACSVCDHKFCTDSDATMHTIEFGHRVIPLTPKSAPSPDAGEWRGPVRCTVCKKVWTYDQYHHPDFTHLYCDGEIIPYDRRAPWDGRERRAGEAGRLRALAWYSRPSNYVSSSVYMGGGHGDTPADTDKGQRARAALDAHPDKSGEKGVCKGCGAVIVNPEYLIHGKTHDLHHGVGGAICGPVEKEAKA